MIRSILDIEKFVICVEHDLAVLDYLSDFICTLYGVPGAYGVVTMPFGVREGINIFLAGFVPTENLRFRDEALSFKVVTHPACLPHSPRTASQHCCFMAPSALLLITPHTRCRPIPLQRKVRMQRRPTKQDGSSTLT